MGQSTEHTGSAPMSLFQWELCLRAWTLTIKRGKTQCAFVVAWEDQITLVTEALGFENLYHTKRKERKTEILSAKLVLLKY